MANCAVCGVLLDFPGTTLCAACAPGQAAVGGGRLPAKTASEIRAKAKICPECRSKIDVAAKRCPSCRANLRGLAERPIGFMLLGGAFTIAGTFVYWPLLIVGGLFLIAGLLVNR